ncbi:hypothetical protein IFM89_016646 [Coptis chinensis]|uniref:Uncharacterized protein n=1 Tax=Coptis chinensis TaxID=261450 RepID=A0A835IRV1_9MAGN|nr:hypothetical protein IFM89_016646 [Coptis chinensis]
MATGKKRSTKIEIPCTNDGCKKVFQTMEMCTEHVMKVCKKEMKKEEEKKEKKKNNSKNKKVTDGFKKLRDPQDHIRTQGSSGQARYKLHRKSFLNIKNNSSIFFFNICIFFSYGEKLREYVDDTEDYINIMLDDKQNHLLQMGVVLTAVLTAATLVVSGFIVVVGIFGMNIKIDLFNTGMTEFLWTVGGGITGTRAVHK